MDSDRFTLVADRLSQLSELDRLEARGTVRIAFKMAGVDVNHFGLDDLEAVLANIMPGELEKRGCADAGAICQAITKSLEGDVPQTAARPRDEIMRRLGSA
jgi:hypothetical protein